MSTHIKVYPAKASALNVHHPIGGKPHHEGVDWPYDVFTCRRISDGSFTEDASKAYKPPLEEAKAATADKPAPPASETASATEKPAAAPAVPAKPQDSAADANRPK